MKRLAVPTVLGAALLLLPTGCAKGPSASSGSGNPGNPVTGRLLTVSLTVRGQVDLANDYYFVAFNVNNTSRNGFTGPVPVVTDFQRGGNGFAGGSFSHYVEIHQNQPIPSSSGSTAFGVYGISADLLTPSPQGAPINAQINGGTLTFEIPLSALATAGITTDNISSLQVNFVTTNNVSTNPQDTTVKYFDALGDPRLGQLSAFPTIPAGQNTTYSNNTLAQSVADHVATYSTATTTSSSTSDYSSSVQVVPDQTPPAIANLNISAWSITFSG